MGTNIISLFEETNPKNKILPNKSFNRTEIVGITVFYWLNSNFIPGKCTIFEFPKHIMVICSASKICLFHLNTPCGGTYIDEKMLKSTSKKRKSIRKTRTIAVISPKTQFLGGSESQQGGNF